MLQLTNANIEILNEVLYRYGIFALLVQEEVKIKLVTAVSIDIVDIGNLL